MWCAQYTFIICEELDASHTDRVMVVCACACADDYYNTSWYSLWIQIYDE